MRRTLAAGGAAAVAMVALDLLFLGVIARGFYDAQLGALKRSVVFWPAAAMFYVMYIVAIVVVARLGEGRAHAALLRGAALGGVCYATYELTNWAVIRDWPAWLVPVDIAWGTVLTAAAVLVARLVYDGLS